MAEGEGFEPPIPFQVYRFSRPTVSTAHTPLRVRMPSCLHDFTRGTGRTRFPAVNPNGNARRRSRLFHSGTDPRHRSQALGSLAHLDSRHFLLASSFDDRAIVAAGVGDTAVSAVR